MAEPAGPDWPFYIKEDGVHYSKWMITRTKDPTIERPWLLLASQRCCLWHCPTWRDAMDMIDWFTRMCRSPWITEPRMHHIQHMRDGVFYPMRHEDFADR